MFHQLAPVRGILFRPGGDIAHKGSVRQFVNSSVKNKFGRVSALLRRHQLVLQCRRFFQTEFVMPGSADKAVSRIAHFFGAEAFPFVHFPHQPVSVGKRCRRAVFAVSPQHFGIGIGGKHIILRRRNFPPFPFLPQ